MPPSASTLALFVAVSVATAITIPHFSYVGEEGLAKSERSRTTTTRRWTLKNATLLEHATDEAAIAYFIQVSESTVPLIKRLLSRLHHPDNFYAIHFDKKIPAYKVVKAVSEIRTNGAYTNIHIMQRESVTYRGITMVLNNLEAITQLLKLGDWEYFINISGADYPLVSPIVQRKLLALPYVREKRSNFFIISPREQWEPSMRYRFERIAVDTALGMSENVEDSELVITDQQTPLYRKLNYEFVKGEGWVTLTREACKFMVSSAYARKMLLSMAFSQEASEHYYVSLFWNHPNFNKTIVPHALRTIYWKLDGVSAGQHPFSIDKELDSDGSYKIWPLLRKSPHFFARKFSEPNSKVMEYIDNEMNGLGDDVNQTAVQESLLRVESNIHWLFGFLDEKR